jgi:L-lactate dehydrogenase complex protein LldG
VGTAEEETFMTSRARVLDRIRAALGADANDLERRSAVASRLADPPRHPIPARASRPQAERIKDLETALRGQGVALIEATEPAAIPATIAAYLVRHGLPLCLRAGTDPYLAGLDRTHADLAFESGPAHATDTTGLSRAVAGVSETGTLVLASGPDNPVTLAFVPETHIIVLAREAIVGSYEDARVLLGIQTEQAGRLPRTVNMVSAASRTGDIGGKIVMGAHGPRRLAVILVGTRTEP